jgi:hypothetical protein
VRWQAEGLEAKAKAVEEEKAEVERSCAAQVAEIKKSCTTQVAKEVEEYK